MSKKKTKHLIAGYTSDVCSVMVIDTDKKKYVWAFDTVQESLNHLRAGGGVYISPEGIQRHKGWMNTRVFLG